MTVNVYRLQYVHGTVTARSARTTLFEDRERFEAALFEAAMEAELRAAGGDSITGHAWRMLRRWWESNPNRKFLSSNDPGVRKVLKAEVLSDGEWKPIEWELVPPRIRFSGWASLQ